MGYMQSKYGYRNWGAMYTAVNTFRTNDLPVDTLILDLYWFGSPSVMGGLTWDNTNFPNPSSNLTALANLSSMVITAYSSGLEHLLFGPGGISLRMLGLILGLLMRGWVGFTLGVAGVVVAAMLLH